MALILFSFVLIKREDWEIPNWQFSVLLVLFYVFGTISISWSLNTADALYESQKVGLGIIIFILVYDRIKDDQIIKVLLETLVLVTCVALIVSIKEYMDFQFRTMQLNNRFSPSLFGHKNLLSSFLFLCLPFLISYARHYCGNRKLLPLALIVILVAFLVLLNTRSVLLALLLAVVFYFFASFLFNRGKAFRIWGWLVFVGVIVAGGATLLFKLNNSLKNNISLRSGTTASIEERFMLWSKTVSVIEENPVIGVGAGNWQYNYTKFSVSDIEKAQFYNTVFKRPHNDFLWIASEVGMIGFLLVLVIGVLIFGKTLQFIMNNGDYHKLTYLSALVGLMVISFFSFPKERMTHITIVAIMIALLVEGIPYFYRKTLRFGRFFGWIVSLVLVVGIWISTMRIYGEYHTQKAILCQQNGDEDGAINHSLAAISTFYTCDPSCTPVISYAGWGYNIKTDLTHLIEANESAYLLSPYDYKVLSNYGYTLLRIGDMEKARAIFLEAYRINKRYEPVLLNLSAVSFNLGEYRAAYDWLIKIKDFDTKYTGNLERIKAKLGSED